MATRQVPEDVDLDFKEKIGERGDALKNVAGDVAGLANAYGGLLIVGVTDEQSRAGAAPGIPLGAGYKESIENVLVTRLSPLPDFEVHVIPDPQQSTQGFLLISVVPNGMAPYAVRDGKSWGYARRVGTVTSWMSENDIAAAYRARFAGFATTEDELARLAATQLAAFGPYREALAVVCLVPDRPGQLPLNEATFQAFSRQLSGTHPMIASGGPAFGQFSIRPRTFVAHAGSQRDKDARLGCHLRDSGAGSFAASLVDITRQDTPGVVALVADEDVTQAVLSTLRFLAEHARDRAGTAGTASVSATLTPPNGYHTLALADVGSSFRDRLGIRAVAPPITSIGIGDIDDMAAGRPGLISAAHRLIEGLAHHFGMPEPRQTTPDGQLQAHGWSTHRSADLTTWADSIGADVV